MDIDRKESAAGSAGSTRLRVAVVAACPYPAGRGTPLRIQRLSEALVWRGHEVHVITYHLGERAPPPGPVVHRIRPVPFYRKTSPGPSCAKLLLLDPLLARHLESFLREHPVDVVHAHHYEGLLAAWWACSRTGHPWVYDAHTLLDSELPTYSLFLPHAVKGRLGRLLDKRLPGRADHVIAVSETIRNTLSGRGGVPLERITVARGGVEKSWISGDGGASLDGPPTVVYAGNLAPYQGVDLLLRAFRRVVETRPDARLRIVTASDPSICLRDVEREGLAGSVDLVRGGPEVTRRELVTGHILVNPRPSCDGIPQKLLNYLAAGRPVVTFASSAELLETEVNAIVVPDGDVRALADGMIRLLGDPELASRLGENALRVARERLSWEGTAARVEEVYRGVIEARAGERARTERGGEGISSLWRYRGLLSNLVVRNIRVKYQSSFLGFAWTLLNPLLMLSVLLAVFTHVVRIPIPHYWAFLVSGFFVWNYVNQTLNYGTLAVEEHGSLVGNFAFPSEILVLAGALSRLIEFVIELLIVCGLLALLHHGSLPASFLLLPLLVVLQFLLTFGLTLVVATLAVFYEDVRHMLPIALTALFYLSPIFYSIDLVPEGIRRFYSLNPIASMLVSFQKVLYEGAFPPAGAVAFWAVTALVVSVVGLKVFRRYRNLFAEIV